MRGLAGLPWVAAEVPEGCFMAGEFPRRSVGWAPQSIAPEPSSNPDHIQLQSRVSLFQGELTRAIESLLKCQGTKFRLQPLTLGSSKEWFRDA